jgi:hypothetical protein
MTKDKETKLAAGYQPAQERINNQFTSGYQPIGEGFKTQGVNMVNLPKDGTGVPPKPKDK